MKIHLKAVATVVPSVFLLSLASFLAPKSVETPTANHFQTQITYAEHVAPILNNSCVKCHRDGQNAPFSLEGYSNAKRYSDMIALVAEQRIMPPWKAKPADVEFKDDAHLSDDNIAILSQWAKAGAPRGDAKLEPPIPTFKDGWFNGTPDLIIEMPYEHQIGAEGEDEYWNFVISPKITEPTWISGIDVEPGNKNIVHHVIAFLDKKGQGKRLAKSNKGDGKFGYLSSGGGIGFLPDGALGGWAPGAHGHLLPSDAGFLLEPGTDIILQMHYNKSGKPESDQTKVALYTHKSKPKNEVKLAFMANPFIRIQPGKSGQKFTYEIPLPARIREQNLMDIMVPRSAGNGGLAVDTYRIYSLMPHMHLLGKRMKATAIYPDGSQKVLIDLQDWDFNWQLIYTPTQPIDLPGGSKIILEAEYDNSSDNPFQPNDPPKLVTWGEETDDEMMLLVSAYTIIPKN